MNKNIQTKNLLGNVAYSIKDVVPMCSDSREIAMAYIIAFLLFLLIMVVFALLIYKIINNHKIKKNKSKE